MLQLAKKSPVGAAVTSRPSLTQSVAAAIIPSNVQLPANKASDKLTLTEVDWPALPSKASPSLEKLQWPSFPSKLLLDSLNESEPIGRLEKSPSLIERDFDLKGDSQEWPALPSRPTTSQGTLPPPSIPLDAPTSQGTLPPLSIPLEASTSQGTLPPPSIASSSQEPLSQPTIPVPRSPEYPELTDLNDVSFSDLINVSINLNDVSFLNLDVGQSVSNESVVNGNDYF
ncbi:hypothetical protein ElyMa_001642600 [Elysia marginata]|uniref:Uncharacterized protein n=1 Tax=Elysia marginata TaxID=1093978 RepID=A0AAV4JMF5_9GAST|nr:hypothetical protein ElyMa_001642600 [Elysia marginata]